MSTIVRHKKIAVVMLIFTLIATSLATTEIANAAVKHKKCDGTFLNCRYYVHYDVPNFDGSFAVDNKHHYVGLSQSVGYFDNLRVKIRLPQDSKWKKTYTLYSMSDEKKVPKRYRNKYCYVKYYGVFAKSRGGHKKNTKIPGTTREIYTIL